MYCLLQQSSSSGVVCGDRGHPEDRLPVSLWYISSFAWAGHGIAAAIALILAAPRRLLRDAARATVSTLLCRADEVGVGARMGRAASIKPSERSQCPSLPISTTSTARVPDFVAIEFPVAGTRGRWVEPGGAAVVVGPPLYDVTVVAASRSPESPRLQPPPPSPSLTGIDSLRLS